MTKQTLLALATTALAASIQAIAQKTPTTQTTPVAIVGGKLLTVSHGTIETAPSSSNTARSQP